MTTTVTLSIVNLAPVAVDDAASVGEDTALVGGNVLTDPLTGDDDAAPDSDPLVVVSAEQGGTALTLGVPFVTAGGGTLTLDANGGYSFVPGTAYNGLDAGETATETITYTIDDGNGGTATALLVLTISGANDTPVVIDPANPGTAINPIPAADPLNVIPDVSTTDGAPLAPIDVGAYIVDPDGEPLTFTLDPSVPAWIAIDPATGVITGTPPADASQFSNTGNPGEYLITITATDPDGALVTTTVTLSIVNLAPVAVDDAASVGEDTASVGGNVLTDPLTGDADAAPDSDPLVVVAAEQSGTALTLGVPFVTAGGGTLTLDANGGYNFVPGTAYNGLDAGETATETIVYTVSDGNGGTDTALLVLTISGANDAPVVIDPSNPGTAINPIPATDPLNIIPDVSTTDGAPLAPINVGSFVVDPDGEPLTFMLDPSVPAWVVIDPATGIITGTPPADASQFSNTGNPGEYLITITATDPDGALVTTTVTLSIVNLAPVAVDDTAEVDRGQPVVIAVLANDIDDGFDRDPLTVVRAMAQNGTVTINSDGTLTYVPFEHFEGTERLVYEISDGNGGFATATVAIAVTRDAVSTLPDVAREEIGGPVAVLDSIEADGAVLEAVEEARSSRRGVGGFAADGIVLDAVAASGAVRSTDSFGSAPLGRDGFDLQGLSSFSLILATETSRAGMTIEVFVRGQVLVTTLGIGIDAGPDASRVAWSVIQADGRPLPGWLQLTGRNTLTGDRPADVETIDLRVIGLLPDGTSISHEVRINAKSGGSSRSRSAGRASWHRAPSANRFGPNRRSRPGSLQPWRAI